MLQRWTWVKRNVAPIAIDFGHRTIRLLQLSRDGRKSNVVAWSHRTMPSGEMSLSQVRQFRHDALADMISEGHFIGRKVISVLPWEYLSVRNLRIPRIEDPEVDDLVRYEACERFGYDSDKAMVRYLPAGEVRQGTDMRLEVIAMGALTEHLNDHLGMLTKLNLTPVSLDAGPCALFRGFERYLQRVEDCNTVFAVVDLGYSATRVIVSRGDVPIFFKSIPIGGQQLDRLISDGLRVSEHEASRLRCAQGRPAANDDGEVSENEVSQESRTLERIEELIQPTLMQLSKEIGLCLRYCSVTFRGMQVRSATFAGGGALDQTITKKLTEQLALPCEEAASMRDIETDNMKETMNRRGRQPEWATVVGAALKPLESSAEMVA